jgi:pimeloyl-ACP methyl ester carboxylesterase
MVFRACHVRFQPKDLMSKQIASGPMLANAHERQTHLENGETWNVLEVGQGQPIVFLHNGGGTLWNWTHQLECFADSYRVIAVDLPGFGRSGRPLMPLSLPRYVHGFAQVMEHLELDRPVLIGNCIGAAIALEVALRSPQRMAGLAIFNVCGGLKMLPAPLAFWAGWRPQAPWVKRLQQFLFGLISHPDLQHLGAHHIYAHGQPDLPPALKRQVQAERRDPRLRGSLYHLALGLESFNVFTQTQRKPEHFPPVLLGWGAQNRTLEPRWADVIAQWLQPERLWLIPEAGHMPMYEQPTAFNSELEAFLQSLAAHEAHRFTSCQLEHEPRQE